jgi:hypothetical protein
MKPVPLQPNLPTPTTALGNPAPIAQYYTCPHCNKQSPLVREWVPLTDEECIAAIDEDFNFALDHGNVSDRSVIRYARAIEAKLRERNT